MTDIQAKKKSVWATVMKIVVPLVITIGLCYLLFTGVNFSEMVDIIKRDCDFRWIGLALALATFSHVIRAARWQIQLDALDCRTPLFYLVLSVFGTYAVNLVFPRLGEVWRSGYISQRQDRPFATVFGSMVAERLADTVTVLSLTLITFLLASSSIMAFVQKYPQVYSGIMNIVTSPWVWGVGAAVVIFFIWFFRRRSENKAVVKIKNALRELWLGFAVIGKMKGKMKWLLLTFALWGCYFLQLYVAFYAFPFTRELLASDGIIVPLVCFVLSSIAMGIPSNGGIGPWQIAVIFGLTIYMPTHCDPTQFNVNATAFANLVMGAQTLLLIVLGIFTFVTIAVLKKKSEKLK